MRTLFRVAIVVFIAMLFFGGAETLGWIHHAWLWMDSVIHGSTPTIHLPQVNLPNVTSGGTS